MKKLISLVLIGLTISGCTLLRPHKADIEQGNIITQSQISRLHVGMSEGQVKAIMGSPMLVNIFTPNRIDYVYTYEQGYGKMLEKRLTCIFYRGRLHAIQTN